MTVVLTPTRQAAARTDVLPASLQWRLVALMAGLLLLFTCASVGLQAWTLAQGLQVEQTARNAQAAQMLAAAWAPADAEGVTLQALAHTRYALGREDRIRVHTAAGLLLVNLDRPAADTGVPDWLAPAWPIAALPGRVSLASDRGPPLLLEVEAATAWAHPLLWQTVSRSAALLALFATVASLLGAAVLRRWLPPTGMTLDPPQVQPSGRVMPPGEAGLPETRGLARRMANTVRRLRQDLALQAEQVLRLQRQAQLDALTGVSLRHHFMGHLQRRLADPPGGRTALLIVRVCELEALNLRAGHPAADRLLCAVGHVLLTYVDRVAGALAGRLNGGDFALCLPVGGMALETAASLSEALAALPALRSAGGRAVVGGVDDLLHTHCSTALAEADAALARAEAGDGNGVAVDRHGDLVADTAGAGAWRQQIDEALTQQRGRLVSVAVRDREGCVLHGICSLHLQLTPGAEHQPPRAWWALARRAQLLPRVDLLTLQLALNAIAADGQPRCVRVGATAWAAPGFVSAAQALLQTAPTQARQLAIELAEPEATGLRDDRVAAMAAWAPTGVRLGVSHGAAQPPALTTLQAAGIAFVTVKGEHFRGLAHDSTLKAYAQGWLQLVHKLGPVVLADGAVAPDDLEALWDLGLDGASVA